MGAVKLLKAGELEDGTIRYQSQLMVGRGAADFIQKDGVMYVWGGRGEWIEYKEPHQIVESKKEMLCQTL
jgi:hypothetical protein